MTDRGLMCTVGLGKRLPQAICDFVVLDGYVGRTDSGIGVGITYLTVHTECLRLLTQLLDWSLEACIRIHKNVSRRERP